MGGIPTRILIWGKTYPELSNQYRETVCTGGCTEDGRPLRIYPVPLRYLPAVDRYRLYSWIEAPIEPSRNDVRPESFRITDPRRISVGATVGSQKGWLERRRIIFRDTSWQYECLEDLKEQQRLNRKSLGLVRVGEVLNVTVERRPEADREKHEKKLMELQSKVDLFHATQKQLEFVPFRIRLEWRCARLTGAAECRSHTAAILDWGLGEMIRRDGVEQAQRRMEEIANLARTDLHLFMGNLKARQHVFGIVGVWYPKRDDVARHPLEPSFFDPEPAVAPPPPRDAERQLPLL